MKTKKLILLIATILVVVSCSSRKSTTQTDKVDLKTEAEVQTKEVESTKVEVNTNVKETKSVTIDKENNVVKEVTEIVPIDATKESVFTDAKGQKYNLNNSKYRNEKTTDLSKEKSVVLSKYELIQKELTDVKKERDLLLKENVSLKQKLKNKDTDKESIFGWEFYTFLFFFLLIIIAMIYIGYKKRKELFLWEFTNILGKVIILVVVLL